MSTSALAVRFHSSSVSCEKTELAAAAVAVMEADLETLVELAW